MERRYEHLQRRRPASCPGKVRILAAGKRHLPRSYAGYRSLTGHDFPYDRKCSETLEDHSQIPRKNPPKHHPRNGLMYTTPARKGYVHSASKPTLERNHKRIARPSISFGEVTASSDCSDGLTPAQRGSARLRGRGDCRACRSIPR